MVKANYLGLNYSSLTNEERQTSLFGPQLLQHKMQEVMPSLLGFLDKLLYINNLEQCQA